MFFSGPVAKTFRETHSRDTRFGKLFANSFAHRFWARKTSKTHLQQHQRTFSRTVTFLAHPSHSTQHLRNRDETKDIWAATRQGIVCGFSAVRLLGLPNPNAQTQTFPQSAHENSCAISAMRDHTGNVDCVGGLLRLSILFFGSLVRFPQLPRCSRYS